MLSRVRLRCERGVQQGTDRDEVLEGDGRGCLFVAVADHGIDARQGAELVRRALGVAARDHDAGRGVAPARPADQCSGTALGFFRNGARIDDND